MPARLPQNRRNMRYLEWSVLIFVFLVFLFVFFKHLDDTLEAAYDSTVKGLAGSLKSGIFLVKSQWLLSGASHSGINLAGYADNDIDVNTKGFPVSAASDETTLITSGQCIEIWNALLSNAPSVSTSKSANTDFHVSHQNSRCIFTHLRSRKAIRMITYETNTGDISIDKTDRLVVTE